MDILYEFAEYAGIDKNTAKEFLLKKHSVTSIEDHLALPRDMKKHYPYTSWVPGSIGSYIADEMAYDRHVTYTDREVVEHLNDALEYGSLEKREYDKLINEIITNKFGSAVYDW